MLSLFYFCLGLLIYIFAGYPALLWLAALLWGKKPVIDEAYYPYVTLIVSAYNEEAGIAEKIENSLTLDYPREKLDIIVASESTDRTNEIVSRYAEKGVILDAFSERKGKAATLFRTVPNARGEIIVFSDANAVYENDAIKKLVRNFKDAHLGCVSGQLRYRNPAGSATGCGEGAYWKYEQTLKTLESGLFSLLGANGSIFAIRKSMYYPLAEDRGDDFELPVQIALRGYGVVLELQAVSWEKASATPCEEFGRKVRIIAWNMESCMQLLRIAMLRGRMLVSFQLVSHKLLRWLVPVFTVGLFISNLFLHGAFFRMFLWAQVLFYLFGAAGCFLEWNHKKTLKVFVIPYYFCLIHASAILGIFHLLCGKQQTIWKKVRA
jgi:cellulose synthase/poly-beta-1,6-N-acetylglucosamine synthase-like glycosyltransferase